MSFKKSLVAFILVYIQVVSLLAAPQALSQPYRYLAGNEDLETKSQESNALIMNVPTANGNAQISYTEIPLESPEQLGELLERDEMRKTDILLSTDTPEIYESVAKTIENTKQNSDREFRFMPIGQLASSSEKEASGWATFKSNVKHNIRYDKIGLSIMLVTTAYDSFIWVHSASYDVYQKSAMVLMNVIFAASFGMDRDLWTRMTVPLRHKITNTLDKLAARFSLNSKKEAAYSQRVLASQFLANLTYSVGFQLIHQSIISFHELSHAVTSTPFWKMSLAVAAITTFSSFAWGELMAAADGERNPVAKNGLRRILDVRNLILSQVASMGMVLQPNIYGATPIIAIVTSGVVGLLALVKSNKVISWLERNKVSNIIFKTQRKFEDVLSDATKARKSSESRTAGAQTGTTTRTAFGSAGLCSALFN